jgi:hypothetical protein
MQIEINEQVADVLGNALVIAARHGGENSGVFVTTWAWLAQTVGEAQAKSRADQERSLRERILAEAKADEQKAKTVVKG